MIDCRLYSQPSLLSLLIRRLCRAHLRPGHSCDLACQDGTQWLASSSVVTYCRMAKIRPRELGMLLYFRAVPCAVDPLAETADLPVEATRPARYCLLSGGMGEPVGGYRARSSAAAALRPKTTANWVARAAKYNSQNLRFAH